MQRSIFSTSQGSHFLPIIGLLLFLLGFSFQGQAQCHNPRHNHSHGYSHKHSHNQGCCNKLFQTHLRIGGSVHGVGSARTPHIGTTVGLVHELHLLRWFQLRAEGNVLWQGREQNFWIANGDVDYFSVNVPLLLQIMPSKRFYLASGLGLSYLVHAQGGPMPNNRLGVNWVGLLHYRFCNRVGLELRAHHRFQNQDAPALTDINGNVIPAFNDSSLQFALTFRF